MIEGEDDTGSVWARSRSTVDGAGSLVPHIFKSVTETQEAGQCLRNRAGAGEEALFLVARLLLCFLLERESGTTGAAQADSAVICGRTREQREAELRSEGREGKSSARLILEAVLSTCTTSCCLKLT